MLKGIGRHLGRDLTEFFKNLETETRWTVFGVNEGRQNELDILMFGPPGSPYENGTFWVHMEIPTRYPLDPPSIEMKTKIFHPLINQRGKICLSILEDWESQSFVKCLNVLYAALEDPAKDLPNAIAEECLCTFVEDRDKFEKIARDYTERFAMSKAKMQFVVDWNKGVTLKFARETKIKDQYKRFRPDLIKRLNKCDYMAFVEFANEIDYFIDDVFLNNLGDTPLNTIVALSGGKGFHKNNYPYGNRYHDQNDRNNKNNKNNKKNRNNRRNNNNQNNNNNNNNTNRGGGGRDGGDGDGGDEGNDSDDGDKYTGNPNEENKRKRKRKKKKKNKDGDNEDDRDEGEEGEESEEDDGTGNNNNNNNNNNNDNFDEEKIAIGRLPSASPTLSTPQTVSCETLPPVIAPRALRDIMLCRGIHNCSGDCGNTLIRASILFYNSLIKGDLDSRLFSEKAHTIEHQEEMWEALLSVFNDDVSNNINMDIIHEYIESKGSENIKTKSTIEKPTLQEEKEEKKKKEVDGEELLVDLMCLVDLMTQTVPEFRTGFDAFETEQWPDNRKGTVFEKVEKLFSKMKDPHRIKRITKWSRVMFEEFRKYHNEYQQRNARNNPNADNNEGDEKHNSNNNNNNNFYVKQLDQVDFYSFNQFLRAVCLHNYGMRGENNNYSGMRNITVDLETKIYVQARNSYSDLPQWAEWSKSTQATNMLVVEKIIKAVKQQFSLQMMLQMASNLGQGSRADAADFDILRLLILTGKFLIECETTFDLHIKCIHNDFSMSNIIKQDKFKRCKLVAALDTDCNKIYDDKRNLMIKGEGGRTEKLLTKDMIKAIRMYTIEEACALIKGTHFKGKTCKYRDICTLMLQALTRLRKYDDFDISKLQKLYCGLRDVSFTVGEFQSTIQPLLEKAGHAKNMDSKDYVATNALEYCIPWHSITSTTPDIRVAKWFAESGQATNSSVVFQVLHKTLANTPDILYGDISWISAHEMEQEVVFGPCLLHPFKPYKNDKNQQLKETTHLIKVRPKPTQHVRSLLQVNWFNKYRLSASYSNSISIGRSPGSRDTSGVGVTNQVSNNSNNSSSGSGSDSSMHSDWEMVGNDDTKTNTSDAKESDEKRELRKWIEKLFIGDSADVENKRQEIFDKFCKSDYNTLELVYENVTNERLKKNVEITQADDRTVIISGVYEYYMTKLDNNQSKVLDVLKRVLNKTKKNDKVKEKLLKQYFVAFRNLCDKCEQDSINDLTKNDLRDDLGIDESGKVRKDILEGIQTQDMVNAD